MTDQRHYAPKTVTLRLSAVKAFLAYASHEDLTLVALSQAAKALKAPVHPRMPIEFLTDPKHGRSLPRSPGRRRSRAGIGCCSSCSMTPLHAWARSLA